METRYDNKNKNKRKRICIWITIVTIVVAIVSFMWFFISDRGTGEYRARSKNTYNSKSVYVYNLTDGKVEIDVNGNKKLPIASLTKLMTCRKALIIMRSKGLALNDNGQVTEEAVRIVKRQREYMVGYEVDESTDFDDLFYAMIMQSDGAAANSLAILMGGDIASFVSEMNEEAESLGLTNTHYETPDGVYKAGECSTAADVASLLRQSLQDEEYYRIFTTPSYISTNTEQHPDGIELSNDVISAFEKYKNKDFKVVGGKFGYTREAGKSIAVLAEKNGKIYIVVTLGCYHNGGDHGHMDDVVKVMNIVNR